MRHSQRNGFTFVQIALTLLVIGIIFGVVIMGRRMVIGTMISKSIAQERAIDTAVTFFRDAHGALPGDMLGAEQKIPNCEKCGLDTSLPTAGDGIIGPPDWNAVTFISDSFDGGKATAAQETVLFWVELAHANFLSNITDDGIKNHPARFGYSLPSSLFGRGWVVGNMNHAATAAIPGRPAALPFSISGPMLVMMPAIGDLNNIRGVQDMTPEIAAAIDTKMDDGLPGTGFIQAYGANGSCYDGGGDSAAGYTYKETISSKDCGLYFSIQR